MAQHFQSQTQNYHYNQLSKQWINRQPVQPQLMSNLNENQQDSIESWLNAQAPNMSLRQWAAVTANKQSRAVAEYYSSSVNAPVHQFVNQLVLSSKVKWAMISSRENDLSEQSHTTPAVSQAFKGQSHLQFVTKKNFKILWDKYVNLWQILQYWADET